MADPSDQNQTPGCLKYLIYPLITGSFLALLGWWLSSNNKQEPVSSGATQQAPPPLPLSPAPVSPEEATKRVDQTCTIEMKVASTRTTEFFIFLDSKRRFKDAGNFTVAIRTSALPEFKRIGVDNPERYFSGKTIIATGKVTLYEGRPQIKVSNPEAVRLSYGK
jgi:DNA/RNA endonuclease YhcR with UshA esterase domain